MTADRKVKDEGEKMEPQAGASPDLQAEIAHGNQVEAGLRQELDKYRALVDSTSDWEFWLDPQRQFVHTSPSCQGIAGYAPSFFEAADAFLEIVHPDDRSSVRKLLHQALDQAAPVDHDLDFRIVCRNGSICRLALILRPMRDAEGVFLGVRGTLRVVTDRKQTDATLAHEGGADEQRVALLAAVAELRHNQEQLLAANEELRAQNDRLDRLAREREAQRAILAAVLQQMPVALNVAEAPSGKVILSSEQVDRMWGLPFRQFANLVGHGPYRGYHADGRPYRPEEWPLARAIASGEVIQGEEISFKRGDGSWGTMAVNAAPIRDHQGQIIFGVAVAYDVTERKSMERALQRSEERLQTANEELRVTNEEMHVQNTELAALTRDLAAERARLATLLANSKDMVSTLDPAQLLNVIADRLKEIIDYDGLAVYGLEGENLVVLEYRGPVPREDAMRLRVPANSAVGIQAALTEGRTTIVSDAWGDEPTARAWRAGAHPELRRLVGPVRSWLAVPLVVKGRVIGALRLSRAQPGAFTERDADLALMFANHAAAALENSRLYEQARHLAAVEERQRLARDLHDAVSQILFTASLTADVLPKLYSRDPAHGNQLLAELRGLTRAAMAEMRMLLLELRPEALMQAELGTLLRQLGEAVGGRSGIPVAVSVEQSTSLPPEVRIALYRIAQEALNNAAKHAKGSTVTVVLARTDEPDGASPQVRLTIEDDGCGFDPAAQPAGRLGLGIMNDRAQTIGASVTIDSGPGCGTRVTVVWPARPS